MSISPINTCKPILLPPHPHKGSILRSILTYRATNHHRRRRQGKRVRSLTDSDGRVKKMSRANGARGARRLDLKLNLSVPAHGDSSAASRRMVAAPADDESSPSSCVSSESEQHGGGALQWSDSPEATSMVLAACPRCFIYVMLAEADPRCPKCRSPVILDFMQGGNGHGNDDDENNRGTNRRGRRNSRE